MESKGSELIRGLGLRSAIGVTIGSVIGTGVFLVASDIAKELPSAGPAIAVWILAGLISLAGALVFAELGTIFPKAGGQYVFLREAFHPFVGFLFGWTLITVIQAGSIAAVAIGFAKFLSQWISMNNDQMKVAATLVIFGLTFLNFYGLKVGSRFLDVITALKILAILAFVGSCFFVVSQGHFSFSNLVKNSVHGFGQISMSVVGVALIASFWAYDGWYSLSFMAGEIQNPKKNIPLASMIGLLSIVVLYVLTNITYYQVLGPAQIASSNFVAADVAQHIWGSAAVQGMIFAVILSAMGCLNGLILTGARVIYAMSKDEMLPSYFSKVNPQNHSPNRALAAQLVWTVLLVWSGTYDQLFTYVVFAAFLFYGLTALAVFRLRKTRPDLERPYSVPLYPYLPLAYLLFTLAFTINSVVEKPKESLMGLAIISFGALLYLIELIWRKRSMLSILRTRTSQDIL